MYRKYSMHVLEFLFYFIIVLSISYIQDKDVMTNIARFFSQAYEPIRGLFLDIINILEHSRKKYSFSFPRIRV